MFDPRSRYRDATDATIEVEDGRVVVYRRRRFLPRTADLHVVGVLEVLPGERLDRLAARTLGDPLQYWQICDANGVMHPEELVDEVPRVLALAQPPFKTSH